VDSTLYAVWGGREEYVVFLTPPGLFSVPFISSSPFLGGSYVQHRAIILWGGGVGGSRSRLLSFDEALVNSVLSVRVHILPL